MLELGETCGTFLCGFGRFEAVVDLFGCELVLAAENRVVVIDRLDVVELVVAGLLFDEGPHLVVVVGVVLEGGVVDGLPFFCGGCSDE